nr:MAG TPA: hypothetical protein [Caudoviricetes sp.]
MAAAIANSLSATANWLFTCSSLIADTPKTSLEKTEIIALSICSFVFIITPSTYLNPLQSGIINMNCFNMSHRVTRHTYP